MVRAFFRAPTGPVSAVLLGAFVLLAIVGPTLFGGAGNHVDLTHASQGPSSSHLLGTTALGQDVLARTLAATRLSILLPLAAIAGAALVGGIVGGIIASAGPRVRRFGAGVVDATMSFGGVLLAVFIVAIVGIGARGAAVAVALAFAPAFARFTYSLVASVNARDYVMAARVVGVSPGIIARRYVFPNIADTVAVATFTTISDGLISIAALSFLGLGVQPPQYDWGQILTTGVQSFYIAPWAALAPAIMIALAGMAFSLFGDALARALNPVLWVEGKRSVRRYFWQPWRRDLNLTEPRT